MTVKRDYTRRHDDAFTHDEILERLTFLDACLSEAGFPYTIVSWRFDGEQLGPGPCITWMEHLGPEPPNDVTTRAFDLYTLRFPTDDAAARHERSGRQPRTIWFDDPARVAP